jgi:mono/diheme cytochrome c family protein
MSGKTGLWTALAAGGMLAVLAPTNIGAQTAKTPIKVTKQPPAARKPTVSVPSTLSGVYTKEQATRGRYVYLGSCRYCHNAATHAGKVFEEWWKGKQLSELFDYVLERMPKNEPGSLAPEDVADVVAYLLQLNAMPAGKSELYPESDSLKKYRIDLKTSGTSTAKGAKP